ncbi:MAG: SGNH/GDSL hydrolase family protein [Rubrivivax sp.]|jgi:lysophospholipase L1-like esterase|nr:SGNH/GDSL hydrolase family protein [Rubrivivax sp.]
MAARWQRLLLQGLLQGLLWLMAPLLWLQARQVRRDTSFMPEPPGHRAGICGSGTLVRLLVAGDSGAAGVGVTTQDQALCGQLVRRLSEHHTVEWCVMAVKGLDSPGLLKLLQDAPCGRFDVVVLSMGANDATGLCTPVQWARWQTRLADVIDRRFAPALLVYSAVPPMHSCRALPQPLRWFMGRWAWQMNHSLASVLIEHVGRIMHWHPDTTTTSGMAEDGVHPNADGYAAWADSLSERILDAQATVVRRF